MTSSLMVSAVRRRRDAERLQRAAEKDIDAGRDWICPNCSRVYARQKNGPMRHMRVCAATSSRVHRGHRRHRDANNPELQDLDALIATICGETPDVPLPLPNILAVPDHRPSSPVFSISYASELNAVDFSTRVMEPREISPGPSSKLNFQSARGE